MLETSAPTALPNWLGGRRGTPSNDHPLLVREKLEVNYFESFGVRSCREKRHVLHRWRHMHDKFYPQHGDNIEQNESFAYNGGRNQYRNGMYNAGGRGYGNGRSSRDYLKSDPEILIDFFFAKFADDGSDPADESQVCFIW